MKIEKIKIDNHFNAPSLFFELIRVSVGQDKCLSKTPSPIIWRDILDLSKKQSIAAITLQGLKKLDQPENKPPLDILYDWISCEKNVISQYWITKRNIKILTSVVTKDGLNYCILKGYGNALLYNNKLETLRQNGDIDVWLDGNLNSLLAWAGKYGRISNINDHHFNLDLFKNQSLEIHYKAGNLINRWRNRFYQNWLINNSNSQFENSAYLDDENMVKVPKLEFNQVFLLTHLHEHFFCEGVGLRHVMDYFFLLKKCNEENISFSESKEIIEKLRLTKFAEAIMWVIKEVFHYDDNLPWKPNNKRGSFVLNDIMRGGNFGHYDVANLRRNDSSHIVRFFQWIKSSCRYIKYFPRETMWSIFDFIYSFLSSHYFRLKYKSIIH